MKRSNGRHSREGQATAPKTFARLRSRSPTHNKIKDGCDFLQVPIAGAGDHSGFDETMATDVTR